MPDGEANARKGGTNELADELEALFDQLIERQVVLHSLAREKLAAMRRADVNGMLAIARRESEEAIRTAELDRQREDVVTRLGFKFGISPGIRGTGVTLRQLLEHLEPEARRRLVLLADRLRTGMLKLAEANRVVELVCREMLAHFKAVFTAMMRDDETPPTYSAAGEIGSAVRPRVFDALG
jgi:hypothetical protein